MSTPPERAEAEGHALSAPVESTVPRRPSLLRGRFVRWVLPFWVGVGLVAVLCWPQLTPLWQQFQAKLYVGEAFRHLEADDLTGALASIDKAMALAPESVDLRYQRAQLLLEANRLAEALEDTKWLEEKNPHFAEYHSLRAQVFFRQGSYASAVEEATRAVELLPPWDAQPLNERAYLRALANVELEAALVDIERAIDLTDPEEKSKSDVLASYLDTRAYVLYRLGRHEQALADMERALAICEEQVMRARQRGLQPRETRRTNEMLAVLYHHRGLIHRALGDQAKADQDQVRGEELGYNPEKGVY